MYNLSPQLLLTGFELIVALEVVLSRGVGHVGEPRHAATAVAAGVVELLLPVAPQVLEEGDDTRDDEAADEDNEHAADVGEAERGSGAVGGHLALASTFLLLPPFFFKHVKLSTYERPDSSNSVTTFLVFFVHSIYAPILVM